LNVFWFDVHEVSQVVAAAVVVASTWREYLSAFNSKVTYLNPLQILAKERQKILHFLIGKWYPL